MIYIGDKELKQRYVGDNEVSKVYAGDNLVWEVEIDKPFIITAKTSLSFHAKGTNITIDWGDGTVETKDYTISTLNTHDYMDDKIYTVTFRGDIKRLYFDKARTYYESGIILGGYGEGEQYDNSGLLSIETPLPPLETCDGTFFRCTSLTSIPANLFANCENVQIFGRCFYRNIGITSIPDNLFANCKAGLNFAGTFNSCENLTSIPPQLFKENKIARDFSGVFSKCTALTEIPDRLFAGMTNAVYMEDLFAWDSGITSIPSGLFAGCSKAERFDGCFGSTSITTIPEKLFYDCINAKNFNATFALTPLIEIPENLFANCPAVKYYTSVFSETQITNIPSKIFPASTETSVSFGGAFYGCQGITAIPAELFKNVTVGELGNGYNVMIHGCFESTNIINVPEGIFSTASKNVSFGRCFKNCKNLISIPQNLVKDDLDKITNFDEMFMGCINLTGTVQSYWTRPPVVNPDLDIQFPVHGKKCFNECTKLSNYADIPAEWK